MARSCPRRRTPVQRLTPKGVKRSPLQRLTLNPESFQKRPWRQHPIQVHPNCVAPFVLGLADELGRHPGLSPREALANALRRFVAEEVVTEEVELKAARLLADFDRRGWTEQIVDLAFEELRAREGRAT